MVRRMERTAKESGVNVELMREREAVAQYLEREAAQARSGGGLAVGEVDLAFAAQRMIACAWSIRAGLHLPDAEPQTESEAA